jgi:hypothetical protein
VGDEGNGDLVDPRVAGQRSGGELGQLPVVAARQALTDLEDVLLDDVEIVEQPLAGGADVVLALLRGGEPVVRVTEDAAGLVQAVEQAVTVARGTGGEPLAPRQGPRPLRQPLGAEQLAPDGAGEELVQARTGAAPETAGEGGGNREGNDGGARRLGTLRQERPREGKTRRRRPVRCRPW